jgi:hypothetical protein
MSIAQMFITDICTPFLPSIGPAPAHIVFDDLGPLGRTGSTNYGLCPFPLSTYGVRSLIKPALYFNSTIIALGVSRGCLYQQEILEAHIVGTSLFPLFNPQRIR